MGFIDNSELCELSTDINLTSNSLANQSADHVTDNEVALLQVRAIAALADQVNQFGMMIEGFIDDMTEPAPSRWQRIRRWLP